VEGDILYCISRCERENIFPQRYEKFVLKIFPSHFNSSKGKSKNQIQFVRSRNNGLFNGSCFTWVIEFIVEHLGLPFYTFQITFKCSALLSSIFKMVEEQINGTKALIFICTMQFYFIDYCILRSFTLKKFKNVKKV